MQLDSNILITPPFGYGEVVPLIASHRVNLNHDNVPEPLQVTNAVPVTMAEMPVAGRDYPIVFVSADQGESFGVVALVGLRKDDNLFLTDEKKWQEDVYFPAYLRRYPFCMATVKNNGKEQSERIICVAREALDDVKGMPLEKQDGTMMSWWSDRRHLVLEYEADLMRTRQMCDILKKLDLLRPFGAQAIGNDGDVTNLSGMYRTDEALLKKLKADDLRMLIDKGIMGRIYAHMMSIDNLSRLLDKQQL